jgi:hypothetical protein
MSFNSTIDIADLLKFASALAGALWFIYKLSGRLDLVTGEIKALKDIVEGQNSQLAAFAKALIDLARQEERINAIDRRVEDLRRGRGYIERDLDGEYMKTGKVR